MSERKLKIYHYVFIALFYLFNLINCILITSADFVENLLPYDYDFYMILSSTLGNFCFLSIILGFGYIFFKKKKNLYIYLLVYTFLTSVFLFVMSVYCNYYGMMFDFNNLAAFGTDAASDNLLFIIEAIPNLIKISVPFFFILFVLLLILHIAFVIKNKKNKFELFFVNRKFKKGIAIILSSIYVIIAINLIYGVNNQNTYFEYNSDPLYSVQSKGILNHYSDEIIKKIFNYNAEKNIDFNSKEEAYNELNKMINYNKVNNEYTNLFNNKNLLLIQMESINNFLIGLEVEIDGKYYEVTPNLNKLVSENIYFDNFYTSVGIGNTSDAEFSVMTGLYPMGDRYSIYEYNQNVYQTLPQLFKEKGYTCYSFHANKGIFYDRTNVHENLYKFDKHYSSELLEVKEENLINHWLADEFFLKQVIDKIYESNEKTFSFAVTITNHTPFTMPKNGTKEKWFNNKENLLPVDYKLSKDKDFNRIYKGYLEYVSYTDYAIGKAINYLKELNIYDDTVIMLYGDHGIDSPIYEMFYDFGFKFRNNINPIIVNNNEHQKLLEMQLMNNVPLIICSPYVQPIKISNSRGLVSLQSTISNLFGLNQKYNFGDDCFNDNDCIVFNPKNGIIYYDNLVLSSRSGIINIKSSDYNINEIIKKYQNLRDINNKILKFDLLRK